MGRAVLVQARTPPGADRLWLTIADRLWLTIHDPVGPGGWPARGSSGRRSRGWGWASRRPGEVRAMLAERLRAAERIREALLGLTYLPRL